MTEDPKFGTDGVRGLANGDLSGYFAFRLGRTAGPVITCGEPGRLLVVGRDTRVSGDMLEAALIAGLLSAGVNVVRLGVLPTPGVSNRFVICVDFDNGDNAFLRARINVLDVLRVCRGQLIELVHPVTNRLHLPLHILFAGEGINLSPETLVRFLLQRLMGR